MAADAPARPLTHTHRRTQPRRPQTRLIAHGTLMIGEGMTERSPITLGLAGAVGASPENTDLAVRSEPDRLLGLRGAAGAKTAGHYESAARHAAGAGSGVERSNGGVEWSATSAW